MSRACPLPRSGDRSKAVMVGVIGRLRVIVESGVRDYDDFLMVRYAVPALCLRRTNDRRPHERRRILPGFMMFFGSSARLIVRMLSSSVLYRQRASSSFC